MFVFGCKTGLRFSDMATLKKDDLREDDLSFHLTIRIQKTGKSQKIALSQEALNIIRKYNSSSRKYLLPILKKDVDIQNERLYKNAISSRNAIFNKRIKLIAAKAGIQKKISMHISRHTMATMSLTLDTPMHVISKLLGHQNMSVTQIYAQVIDKSLVEAVSKFDNI